MKKILVLLFIVCLSATGCTLTNRITKSTYTFDSNYGFPKFTTIKQNTDFSRYEAAVVEPPDKDPIKIKYEIENRLKILGVSVFESAPSNVPLYLDI